MMIHPHYGEGQDYYQLNRHNRSAGRHTQLYDRTSPYGFLPRYRDEVPEYSARRSSRQVIQEPEGTISDEQPGRKRTAVACQRCRKRKIKCSGETANGLGCTACRSAGAEGAMCMFMRVGTSIDYGQVASTPGVSSPPSSTPSYNNPQMSDLHVSSSSGNSHSNVTWPQSRASLASYQLRVPFPAEYEAPYASSQIDGYDYGSPNTSRHDSQGTAHRIQDYRTWSTTAPLNNSVTTTLYEPFPNYSFGNFQTATIPHAQQQPTRLPSMTVDEFSPLNMSQLNSSLPAQKVEERRLPAPIPEPVQSQRGLSQTPTPQRRPFGSNSDPRLLLNGVRDVAPWPADLGSTPARMPSISSYVPPNGQPICSSQHAPLEYETMLGYQYRSALSGASSSSPGVSPTSGSSIADACTSTSYGGTTQASSDLRLPSASTQSSQAYPLPAIRTTESTPARTRRVPPPLFTFSGDRGDGNGVYGDDPGSDDGAGMRSLASSYSEYTPSLRYPQPHHVGSTPAVPKSSSQEDRRTSKANRMSVSNLSASY